MDASESGLKRMGEIAYRRYVKRDKTGTEIRLWGISQLKGEKRLEEKELLRRDKVLGIGAGGLNMRHKMLQR